MERRRTIVEHERVPRALFGEALLARLQAFDERHAAESGDTIFDWSRRADIRARNYVGVLQVPGLALEILPKVDADDGAPDDVHARAQHNLLYMLGYSTELPVRRRSFADLAIQRMPLLDSLVLAFAEGLLGQLGRGAEHAYVPIEEMATFVRGRILLPQQLRGVGVHRERIAVAYDDFSTDTRLNQILRAGCERLARTTTTAHVQRVLRRCLLHLGDVSPLDVQPHHFDGVTLDRNAERFRPYLDFCELVLHGKSPLPGGGRTNSFSLLFPMELVFEQFVAGFLVRHARQVGLRRSHVHPQARARRRWLVRNEAGRGEVSLRPDLVIDDGQGGTHTIIDTKWKRLGRDPSDRSQGVQPADLYQLHAYARRYACPNNVLLYPLVAGGRDRIWLVEDAEGHRLRVAFVDVSRDLATDPNSTVRELRAAVFGPEATNDGGASGVRDSRKDSRRSDHGYSDAAASQSGDGRGVAADGAAP